LGRVEAATGNIARQYLGFAALLASLDRASLYLHEFVCFCELVGGEPSPGHDRIESLEKRAVNRAEKEAGI
jgi:hypothetical protein